MNIEWFAIGVGAIVVLYILYHFIKMIWSILGLYVFYQPIDLKKKAGASWAVITGGTDGIGKSFSFELAKRGFNIYIVSRTQSKLEQTKKEIMEKYSNVEVRFATFDFTNPSISDYKKLLSQLNEVSIGMLINNVGMLFEYPENLHKTVGGIDVVANVTILNTLPVTLLSAGILPQMVSRKTGIIVNIGSVAGAAKMAEWSVYSASKKYVEWLTGCLRKEYEHQGIIIQAITPALVATKLSGHTETSLFCPDSATFAKSALNTVGHTSQTTGYINHQIQCEMLALFPECFLDSFVKKSSVETREKALAKKENKHLL
ncbi:Putative steroid dehydrogenase 3 [Caenorhabditis elegans]|uniref:Putative steroid dehydrogenase 3 n=1 Tax=Caenorhabditis elegans TaxID=6239 RepID=STDH3_CAEEL|nr:Putative steroid dehydrogenase 3 [Caenorhabditis elegans]Q17704.2 RecName: Full=Putative steroid dehydrogenase 3 [Caenorhabditis elegans]CAB01115.2 Putative steroid dehydrogenase 3 [Caenorhabditis elegans]|eukprot:NP_506448.2 Putative steroid dehydrogenase 3 [Caenorhabditis elegans]